jgi:hypothetical protein
MAHQTDALKEIVYEMRFDEVSARYGDFGPFYVNLRAAPAIFGHNFICDRTRFSRTYGPSIGLPVPPCLPVSHSHQLNAMLFGYFTGS